LIVDSEKPNAKRRGSRKFIGPPQAFLQDITQGMKKVSNMAKVDIGTSWSLTATMRLSFPAAQAMMMMTNQNRWQRRGQGFDSPRLHHSLSQST